MDKTGRQIKFSTDRVIVNHDDGNDPELEPLFANHFDFIQLNTDIFLDVGIVKPQDMIAALQKVAESGEESFNVNFAVLQRIAMSPATFQMLRQKINDLGEQLDKGVIVDASSQNKKAP